jgi:cyclopropane-fatty-acyl-phospholipid synthase
VLDITDELGTTRLGRPDAGLHARILVRDPRFYRALALRGASGGAHGYMQGWWKADDLTAVIRILARNTDVWGRLDGGTARLARYTARWMHRLRRNTRRNSRRNISAHYDLGNDFFALFLDPTLTYSSGIFPHPTATMEEASLAKYERICRKLHLSAPHHVLEIGCGWGGFALYAARTRGCRVTATTISREQHALARERVKEAGLDDRIELRLEDYRDIRGTYDRVVSIEMIEAVGHQYLDDYFHVCSDRLDPSGAMALQAIVIRDQDYEASTRTTDFIKEFIFPGGQIVSLAAILGSITRATDLRMTHVEDLSVHYAETLRRWRHRMRENLGRMRELGLSDSFLAMWEFYLCYCEGGFEERSIGVHQIVFEKPLCRSEPILGALVA